MSTITDRITEVLRAHQFHMNLRSSSQQMYCTCQEGCSQDGYMLTMEPDHHAAHVADAVQDVLELWLPPLFASAIHAYAEGEALSLPGCGPDGNEDPSAEEVLQRLNNEAASIAQYALTSTNWKAAR